MDQSLIKVRAGKLLKQSTNCFIGLFVILLPLNIGVLPILIGVICLLLFFQVDKGKLKTNYLYYRPYFLPFGMYFLWIVISLFWTANLYEGIKVVEHRLFYLIAPLLFLLKRDWPYQSLLKLFVYSCFVICVYCFLDLIVFFFSEKMYFVDRTLREGITWETFRYIAYHSGVNFISFDAHRLYFSFSLLSAVIFLVFFKRLFISRNFRYLTLILFAFVIFLLQSKVATILLVSLLFYESIDLYKRAGTIRKVFILGAVAGIIGMGFYLTRIRFGQMINQFESLSTDKAGSLIERVQYTKSALELIAESPIIGYGAGDINQAMLQKIKQYDFKFLLSRGVYDPHNEYLKAYIGTGIVGFLIFTSAFVIGIVNALRKKNKALLIFFLFVGFICLFEPFLSRQSGILHTFFLMGILVFIHDKSVQNECPASV